MEGARRPDPARVPRAARDLLAQTGRLGRELLLSAAATFGTIAVGYEGGEAGRDALRLGAVIARATGDSLLAVRVRSDSEEAGDTPLLDEVRKLSGDGAPAIAAREVRGQPPARALHELARAEPGIGLIVLGSTHRAGLGRVFPGSVAQQLLNGAPCAVAVAPRGYSPVDLRVIAVGFDGSRESSAALELGVNLGIAASATLRVIAVEPPIAPAARAAEAQAGVSATIELRDLLHDAVRGLPSGLRALPISRNGDPADQLVELAELGVDLLIVGSRGHGPVRAVLLGSVSAKVLSAAPCPVIVAPVG